MRLHAMCLCSTSCSLILYYGFRLLNVCWWSHTGGSCLHFTNIDCRCNPTDLSLLVMSLERCVSVCHSLRHTSIIAIRNTWAAMVMTWAFGFLTVFFVLVLNLSFSKGIALKKSDSCGKKRILQDPVFKIFGKYCIYLRHVLTAVLISSTYIGVIW